jgi:EAL domain-containing protein (putative c-di-GMP-specific phosphodiesterase class I)
MNDNKGALDTIRFLTAIIVFAHSLNLKVVAEGVEKRETLESLQWAGCDEVQGYLFAKPMPLPELERYIATGQDEITTGRWREL